ncbi:MAG: sulfatase-like hydrolase/transferase [Acidobacteria bacterium]|nr:sulfatase-like hydrolase/transferase [Acidobacteriota bacterium]
MMKLLEALRPPARVQTPWRLWDYAFVGFLGGLALTLLEAIDRAIVLAPFFSTSQQRFLFLAYFTPTLLSTTLMGVLIGVGLTLLRVLGRLEHRFLETPSQRWKHWVSDGVRLLLLGVAAVAVAIMLRPSFIAIGRRASTLGKERMRRFSPDGFEMAKSGFQWVEANPLIALGVMLMVVWLIARWIGQRPAIRRLCVSKQQGLMLAPLALLLMGGVYSLDSRYYFSIYDRSVHLPLSLVQLMLGLTWGALIYWRFSHRLSPWIKPSVGGGILAAMTLTALAFINFDNDQSLKALFWSRSVVARRTITFLQWALDSDRDGFAAILGGGDCDDTDPRVNPLAQEIPDNGIDENCLGGDLELQKAEGRRQKAEETRVPATSDQRPATILLITIDALRADHLGCYGYERPTSPHLDQFAQRGQLFVNAYSQGTNTGHSFASMFRSAYGEDIFDEARPTFIQILAEHGYTTVSFSAKRMEKWLRGKTWARYKPTLLKGIQIHAHEDELGQWSADEITDGVIAYLKGASPDKPSFIWAHYLEPHYPYRRYPEFNFGENRVDHYDSEIAYADRALGRLFEYLDQSNAWPTTLVIISADHGEAFFEHGQQEHSSRPYQEQIHVPLLVRHPTEAPARFNQPVGLIDVGPTILRFAGIDPPAEYEGVDLFSATAQTDRLIFSETPRNIPEPSFYVWAMMDGSWKLMYGIVGQTFELYNLQADPGERSNLVDARPEKAREMKTKFGRWFDLQSLRPVHSGDWSVRHLLRK